MGIPAALFVGSIYLDLRKGPSMIRKVLREYDRIDDSAVVRWERKIPAGAETHLIYALRVAKPGLRAKTLKTLISRWAVVHEGAGGAGLNAGEGSAAYEEVRKFLYERFAATLDSLCLAEAEKAHEQSAKRKTSKAKANALLKSSDRLDEALASLWPRNDEMELVLSRHIEWLTESLREFESAD